MVGSQVIHTTSFSLVIGPLCVKPFCGRAVIGDSIKLDCFLLTVFGTFQFIPFVIGFPVAIDILHHEHNARFVRGVELVAHDREIVSSLVFNAMVETDNDISAPCAQ